MWKSVLEGGARELLFRETLCRETLHSTVKGKKDS